MWKLLNAETSEKVGKENYDRIFDQAKLRVRAGEQAHLGVWRRYERAFLLNLTANPVPLVYCTFIKASRCLAAPPRFQNCGIGDYRRPFFTSVCVTRSSRDATWQ